MTDQTLKFKVKAPPEKGAANKVLTAYLSKALNLRQEEVKINTGKNSRVKILELPDHTSLPW